MTSPAEDRRLLEGAARAAGERIMPFFQGRSELTIETKSGDEPVTEADYAADALLKDRLLEARPDYGWLSEETEDTPDRLAKARVFIVDPIDGTRAFIKGRPHFAVSAAVVEDGRPIAGAIYNPALGELYSAALGGGATLNGAPIRATAPQGLDGLRLLASEELIGSRKWPRPWPEMAVETRNSIAYRVALVAAGAFDAVFAPTGKSDWDIAAADIIAREAGARMTALDGTDFRYNQEAIRHRGLVCAAEPVHGMILARAAEFPRR